MPVGRRGDDRRGRGAGRWLAAPRLRRPPLWRHHFAEAPPRDGRQQALHVTARGRGEGRRQGAEARVGGELRRRRVEVGGGGAAACLAEGRVGGRRQRSVLWMRMRAAPRARRRAETTSGSRTGRGQRIPLLSGKRSAPPGCPHPSAPQPSACTSSRIARSCAARAARPSCTRPRTAPPASRARTHVRSAASPRTPRAPGATAGKRLVRTRRGAP